MLGAGEILLTSMDTDGVQTRLRLRTDARRCRANYVPVIASGGAGKPTDFVEVLTEGHADAAFAASVFHYGKYTVGDLKQRLARSGCSREADSHDRSLHRS